MLFFYLHYFAGELEIQYELTRDVSIVSIGFAIKNCFCLSDAKRFSSKYDIPSQSPHPKSTELLPIDSLRGMFINFKQFLRSEPWYIFNSVLSTKKATIILAKTVIHITLLVTSIYKSLKDKQVSMATTNDTVHEH